MTTAVHEHGHGAPCSAPHGPSRRASRRTSRSATRRGAAPAQYLARRAHARIIYVLRFLLEELGCPWYIIGRSPSSSTGDAHDERRARVRSRSPRPPRRGRVSDERGDSCSRARRATLGVAVAARVRRAGVPGAIASLNGCNIPRARRRRCGPSRSSASCSVASGRGLGGHQEQIGGDDRAHGHGAKLFQGYAQVALARRRARALPGLRAVARRRRDRLRRARLHRAGAPARVAAAFESPISATVDHRGNFEFFARKAPPRRNAAPFGQRARDATRAPQARARAPRRCVVAYHMVSMLGAATGETASAVFAALGAPYARVSPRAQDGDRAVAAVAVDAARAQLEERRVGVALGRRLVGASSRSLALGTSGASKRPEPSASRRSKRRSSGACSAR